MDALGQNLARFVSAHLTPATDVLEPEVLRQLWAGLGQSDESLHFLVRAQLRFENDQLLVHPEFAEQEDAPELVADALLGLAKFPKFTESRWLSVATAARSLTAVLLVGMDSWVETCFKAEHHSEYYLGGYRRLTPQHKTMLLRIAMASYPADAFLAEVLEDDRLNRSSARYSEAVLDEIVYLANVDLQVWQMLAGISQGVVEPELLRSDCLHAALVIQAFIRDKALSQLESMPFTLAHMSPEVAIETLKSPSDIEYDLVTMKLRALIRLGAVLSYSEALIHDAIALLKEISVTTLVVEQAHASATVMRRQHLLYQKEVLCCRAFMHTIRSLFSPSIEETRQATLLHRADQIKSKQPQKINGKGIFMRDFFAAARVARMGTSKQNREQRQALFAEVGRRFSALPLSERLRYEAAAESEQQASINKLEDELAHVHAQMQLQQERRATALMLDGTPMRLSAARLTQDELVALDRKWQSWSIRGSALDEVRAHSMRSPHVPEMARIAELDLQVIVNDTPPPLPQWLREICSLRKHTSGAVLRVVESEEHHYYWVLYASLSPYKLVCKPIDVCTRFSPESFRFESFAELRTAAARRPLWKFAMLAGTVVDPLRDLLSEPQVDVLLDAFMSGDNHICSWSSWINLQALVLEADEVRGVSNTHRSKKAKTGTAFTQEELVQYPWLAATHERKSTQQPAASSSSTNRRIPQDYDEARLQEALHEFQRKKKEWELSYAQEEHFVMVVKGGRWAQAVLNTNFHLVEAKASSDVVARWCQERGLHRLASFTFTKYTERGASLLAQLWCHRMSHLYALSADGSLGSSSASAANGVAAYEEPEAAAMLLRHCGNLQAVHKRLHEIRAIRPGA
eukprot:4519909-Amphidinium_carterae.1